MLKLENKVVNVKYVVITLVLFFSVTVGCGLAMILPCLISDSIDAAMRMLFLIFGGVCILLGIAYTGATLFLLSVYPRHKRLMYLFLRSWVFLTDEEIARREGKH